MTPEIQGEYFFIISIYKHIGSYYLLWIKDVGKNIENIILWEQKDRRGFIEFTEHKQGAVCP